MKQSSNIVEIPAMSAATPCPPVMRDALSKTFGARFYRCALQVNPHHYADTFRGRTSSMDEESYVQALLEQATELRVKVLAITDHNHVGSVDKFRALAKEHNIQVLPGFELASSEGVHVLCLYALDVPVATLERYLGEFGIRDTDPSSKLSPKGFHEILAIVRQQGGISIAAHVTQDNGLLICLHGQARVQAWRDENLLAVQIPGAVDDLQPDKRDIMRNKDANYRREPARAANLALAVVNAKDVATPDDLAEPGATCWIKMSEVSVDGLRQAFLDPESRIRLNSDPPPEDHAEFVAMAWQGGFLDGAAIHFNENLNVLIGGRGTGKSTAVESLRYVLGLQPLGDDARRAHEGIVMQVLRSGTKISLLVRVHQPAEQLYLVERTIPNPAEVRDSTGAMLPLTPRDVFPQVEIYGQHEISELTKSREKLTRLIERFAERDPSLRQRKAELRLALERSRSRILDTRKELQQIEERLASLPALEETLKLYQARGLEDRLKEQSLLVREERILRLTPERLAVFRELLQQLRGELPIDTAFVSPKALDELPGKAVLANIENILAQLSKELAQLAAQWDAALQKADTGLQTVRAKWEERKQTVQAAYEKILRELQKSKVDGAEFIRLRRQIEELRPLKERQAALKRALQDYEKERRQFVSEWEDVKATDFRELQRAEKKVNRHLRDRVQVTVTFAGNREPLIQHLKDNPGGRLSETIEKLKEVEAFSLREFADACRAGRDVLVQKYGLPGSQAERLAQVPMEALLLLEELDLPATTRIDLNVAAEGQSPAWQSLEALSTGQKATAVLLLLLLESKAPLVVDQPEDDLDNRFITEGIVPKMREEKRRRQFIFATHNANIPVLGDAELIIGLSASGEGGQGRAEIADKHLGSIDARPVRELVEEVLEGGREAFEMRRLKYGF
jgi:DNA repair ATPase RecN